MLTNQSLIIILLLAFCVDSLHCSLILNEWTKGCHFSKLVVLSDYFKSQGKQSCESDFIISAVWVVILAWGGRLGNISPGPRPPSHSQSFTSQDPETQRAWAHWPHLSPWRWCWWSPPRWGGATWWCRRTWTGRTTESSSSWQNLVQDIVSHIWWRV